MTTEHRPRPPTSPGAHLPNELKRIPLPPLPQFRRPGAERQISPSPDPPPGKAVTEEPHGTVTHLEMSELLGPDHEGGIASALESGTPQRTGTTGATILNDLVDEIERGLEKELARSQSAILAHGYRRIVPCTNAGPVPGTSPVDRSHRRTSE